MSKSNPLQQRQDFTAQIREKAAAITASAKHIRINENLIAPYTQKILAKYPLITTLDDFHFLSEASPEQTAAYVLALDSINFGSGYFHVDKKSGVDLEYQVIAVGLKNAFLSGRMNTPDKWAAATAQECHDIFGIPQGKHTALDELMQLFAKHLRYSGEVISKEYGGDVLHLVKSAGNSAALLAETVALWPTFADAPFYKRAQIFAADIHLALKHPFTDMDDLTIFADNMVPHVLRCDGILKYSEGLADKIDAGIMIESGSTEELELRASAIHAVELMKQSTGGRVTSVNIDHILWNRGYEPEIYSKPSHRTMTVWY